MQGKGQSLAFLAVGERQSCQSQRVHLDMSASTLTESMRLEPRNDSNKIVDCLDFD